MIWIIALVIAGVWIGYKIYNDPWWLDDIFLYGILIICFLLIAGIVIAGASTGVSEYGEPVVVEQTSIVAMRDNSAIEGHISGGIFFTSGYVDEKPVYTVLIKTDKGLTTKNYKAEETYIQYIEDGSAPRVETLEMTSTSKAFKFWCGFDPIKNEYIIWVPADADIADDFIVDLE
jgi:hypothetical protein